MALRLLEPISKQNPDDDELSLGIASLYLDIGKKEQARRLAKPILEKTKPTPKQSFYFANLLLQLGDFNEALALFEESTSPLLKKGTTLDKNERALLDVNCWNFSLMLLRLGFMKRGWELFEHGRRVPNGKNGMQRTVFKAHPNKKICEWDGSSLKGKKLLINGEQGIGDTMMFSMLLNGLLKEADQIGLIVYDRLTDLYRRSFPAAVIYDNHNLKRKDINPSDWDLQVPIGSIPMLRYNNFDSYKIITPFLVVDHRSKKLLWEKYRPTTTTTTTKLIGFSWKGGGNAKQKKTKSLRLEDFLPLFNIENTQWISLQYGDIQEEIQEFNKSNGLNIIHPSEVDPLKNMDQWCSLVACCDQVVSAANTTIHGAGCLGIPTIVLLAKDPDWRWLGDENAPCYWYPSVKIARQKTLGRWDEAISEAVAIMN